MDDATALDLPDPPARDVYLSGIRAADGAPVMFAVDSKGRTAGKVVLRGIVTREAAERILWARLDEIDPVPVLRLVRGAERPPMLSTNARLALLGLLKPRSPSRSSAPT